MTLQQHYGQMDLRQLRDVDAVARWANFTRAAAELHVAQPALSRAIRNLEAELGVRLFERTSRRVTVTDAGTAFLVQARRILEQVDALGDEMAGFAGAIRGHVRVSVWYHADPDLPALLHDFISGNPQIKFSIAEKPTPEVVNALRQGELDFALGLLLPGIDLADIDHTLVRTEPLAVAVSHDHPLASATAVTLQGLAAIQLVAPFQGTALRALIDQAFAGAGLSPDIVVETNEVAAAVAYAGIGIGGVILPSRIIKATGTRVAILPTTGVPQFETALIWSRLRRRGPAAERTLAAARSSVPRTAGI